MTEARIRRAYSQKTGDVEIGHRGSVQLIEANAAGVRWPVQTACSSFMVPDSTTASDSCRWLHAPGYTEFMLWLLYFCKVLLTNLTASRVNCQIKRECGSFASIQHLLSHVDFIYWWPVRSSLYRFLEGLLFKCSTVRRVCLLRYSSLKQTYVRIWEYPGWFPTGFAAETWNAEVTTSFRKWNT